MSLPAAIAPRRRRRWLIVKILASAIVLMVAGVAGLPWYLGTPSARRWMLDRANAAMAPGRLDVTSFRLSWFGPTRMTGFALIDPQGDRVVHAPEAVWDRNLGQILFARPRLGTLTLEKAALDVERKPDGSIDLVETLGTILKDADPPTSFVIRVIDGSLRVRMPALIRPVEAERFDLIVRRPSAPSKISWSATLSRPDGAKLLVSGDFDRWGKAATDGTFGLGLDLDANRWPMAIRTGGLEIDAAIDGKFGGRRANGTWEIASKGHLLDANVSGPILKGDRLHETSIAVNGKLSNPRSSWVTRDLELSASFGSIRTAGAIPPARGESSSIDATLDLAAIIHEFPRSLARFGGTPLEKGLARLTMTAAAETGRGDWAVDGRFRLDSGSNPSSPSIDMSAMGRVDLSSGDFAFKPTSPPSGAISLDPKGIRASRIGQKDWSLDAGLVGDLAAVSKVWSSVIGGPSPDIRGDWSAGLTITRGPDGPAIDARLATSELSLPNGDSRRIEKPINVTIRANYQATADRVELVGLDARIPYVSLAISGRLDDPFGRRDADFRGTLTPDWAAFNSMLARRVEPEARVEGSIRPFWLKGPIGDPSMEFEAGFDLQKADIYGMNLGPTPIVVRQKGGKLAIDPIETTLNQGRLHLEPSIADLGPRGTAIVLGPESMIENAEVNQEVSRRVLSFVAPILEKSTSARGRISIALRKAEFPIVREAGQKAIVEGDVAFRDVEFVPGPLADDLFALVGRQPATIKLTKPILLSIAEGRVNTRGLAIPLGDVTEIALEGSVDFDKNLDLVASIPLTPAMVGGRPLLGDIVSGTRVSVPIKGTLSAPRIDRESFKLGMKDMGKDLLERGAVRGAMGLLDLITRPRDPNAPPPPPRLTPEERRARRLERRRGNQ